MSNMKLFRSGAWVLTLTTLALCSTQVSTQVVAATGSVAVSASVANTCALISTPAMSFTLDPSTTTAGTGNSTVTYKCTKNNTTSVFQVGGVSDGTAGYSSGTTALTGALSGGGTFVIPYSITWTKTGTSGFGAASGYSAALAGSILNSAFVDAPAGNYTGSVSVTINP